MTKKIGDKKISGVKVTRETGEVESVGEVGSTSSITGVRGVGSVTSSRITSTMSAADREKLFKMIDEEAQKLFPKGSITARQRKIVQDAVKMAIDSGIVDESDGSHTGTKKK